MSEPSAERADATCRRNMPTQHADATSRCNIPMQHIGRARQTDPHFLLGIAKYFRDRSRWRTAAAAARLRVLDIVRHERAHGAQQVREQLRVHVLLRRPRPRSPQAPLGARGCVRVRPHVRACVCVRACVARCACGCGRTRLRVRECWCACVRACLCLCLQAFEACNRGLGRTCCARSCLTRARSFGSS